MLPYSIFKFMNLSKVYGQSEKNKNISKVPPRPL